MVAEPRTGVTRLEAGRARGCATDQRRDDRSALDSGNLGGVFPAILRSLVLAADAGRMVHVEVGHVSPLAEDIGPTGCDVDASSGGAVGSDSDGRRAGRRRILRLLATDLSRPMTRARTKRPRINTSKTSAPA